MMEIVVGRDYVYGRFNTAATVIKTLEGYTPVEIRLQNNRTCWVHRSELRETMPVFDFKYESHAEGYQPRNEKDYQWHGVPETVVLQEDVTWTYRDGPQRGIKKGTPVYIRATHDVLDRFILSSDPTTTDEVLLVEVSGMWLAQQKRIGAEKERKIREMEIVEARLDEVVANAKNEEKENRRAIWANKVDRFFDWAFNVAPFFFFFVSLFFAVFGGMQEAIWSILSAVFFGVVKVVDAIYLVHYKMGRMSDANSE